VAGSPTSFWVEVLTEDGWPRLRDIRLTALNSDPPVFLSSHEAELAFDERQWRQEFSRGEWHVMVRHGTGEGNPGTDAQDIGLVGVTREPDTPSQERYLEYLWVARRFRRLGMASMLLRTVLDRLRESRVQTVWLYILDGNDDAMRLYQRFGFQSTNEVLPLPNDPTRTEERLRLRLY
jgi:ribosomal protein S18 acetylase RimI-like enzyme